MNKRNCPRCGREIPEGGSKKPRKFCSVDCQWRFNYAERRGSKMTNAERGLRRLGRPPTPLNLSEPVTAWFAALVDGEGYVGLSKRRNRAGENFYYCPHVAIYNTSRVLLDRARELIGDETKVVVIHKPNGTGRKICHALKLHRLGMIEFLTAIQPWLVIKKRQAQIVIEYCRISDECLVREYPAAKYAEMWTEMQSLNKRGL